MLCFWRGFLNIVQMHIEPKMNILHPCYFKLFFKVRCYLKGILFKSLTTFWKCGCFTSVQTLAFDCHWSKSLFLCLSGLGAAHQLKESNLRKIAFINKTLLGFFESIFQYIADRFILHAPTSAPLWAFSAKQVLQDFQEVAGNSNEAGLRQSRAIPMQIQCVWQRSVQVID